MEYDIYSDDELREMLRGMIMRLSEEECGELRGNGLPRRFAPRNDREEAV